MSSSVIYPVLVFGFYRCKLLQALVSLFELPKDESTPDDEHFIEIEDTPGICITMQLLPVSTLNKLNEKLEIKIYMLKRSKLGKVVLF